MDQAKAAVRAFWDEQSCGEVYAEGATADDRFRAQREARYTLEPYIRSFARFPDGHGKEVLEIGVGMGADHMEWADVGPRRLVGIDLSPRAIAWTAARANALGIAVAVAVGDAERLPFPDASFDLVYSWGVLHHTPSTEAAVAEIRRVLRPGGQARIMIYHRPSIVGLLLWARYGLARRRPGRSLGDIYASHLESPGTKGFTVREARHLFSDFREVDARSDIGFGDLLKGAVGQQHEGVGLRLAKRLWPRVLLARLPWLGLTLYIDAIR